MRCKAKQQAIGSFPSTLIPYPMSPKVNNVQLIVLHSQGLYACLIVVLHLGMCLLNIQFTAYGDMILQTLHWLSLLSCLEAN